MTDPYERRHAKIDAEIRAQRERDLDFCQCGHRRGDHFERVAHCYRLHCECCSFNYSQEQPK